MSEASGAVRETSVSRIIRAPRQTIYEAFMNPEALVEWLPPQGMRATLSAFEPQEGGTYRMVLTYLKAEDSGRGKSSDRSDVVRGRFGKLIPNERIVQHVAFESGDPEFGGEMTITWTFADVPGGTNVTVVAENEPAGIRPDDHEAGMTSTLANLAAFTE